MFTNFCAQFIFVEILANEPCPTEPRPSTDMWAEPSADLETLPRALDPRRILFPQSTLLSFCCPACNNSARVPSPMDGADASSPARGRRSIGRRRFACRARLLCPLFIAQTPRACALHSPLPLSHTALCLFPLFRPILA